MPPAGAAEEREESEQVEQEGDHRARIFSGFRADRSTTCSPDGVLAKDRMTVRFIAVVIAAVALRGR